MDTTTAAPDASAHEATLHALLPYVRALAGRLCARLPASVQQDDLVQEGLLAAWLALPRYEAGASGATPITFALHRARGAMLDLLRQSDWMPRADRRALRALDLAELELLHCLDSAPTLGELAAELGVTLEDVAALQRDRHQASPLPLSTREADEDDDRGPAAPEEHGPEGRLMQRERDAALHEAIDRLPPATRTAMRLRLDGTQVHVIAQLLRVSESRVSRIVSHATALLRGRLHWRFQ
jgi:RNA polymerase sigma factor for flagellar operon FliA